MTNSLSLLKIMIIIGLIGLFALAFVLWSNTPELFNDFNMAFCAH